MELVSALLREQPFRIHGKPLVFVQYESQLAAHDFLERIRAHPKGLGLFLGPPLSGKSALIRAFVNTLDRNAEVAVVDGAGLNTTSLLEAILGQYGFQLERGSVNELLSMLKVFTAQRTASGHAPMLVIENTHGMNPSAMRVLGELAQLKVRQQSAIRIVLASDRDMTAIISAPGMKEVADRITAECHLGPLSESETAYFLYEKLRAAGSPKPELLFPEDVCREFHAASGGWPGVLDRLALLALANAPRYPVGIEHIERPVLPEYLAPPMQMVVAESRAAGRDPSVPRLILTLNGAIVRDIGMTGERLIIGRADYNDLQIDSKFVSRHHALLVRHGSTTLLMDLNSTNGTFVNSRRISNQVMAHDDILTLGNHRLKFIHPMAGSAGIAQNRDFGDTVIMKTLQDMREMLSSENTQIMAVVPTSASSNDT